MSKEYVMQLESTIENYKRDNKILKEELFKYRKLEEKLGCLLEIRERALQQDEIFYIEKGQTKMLCVVVVNCGYINNGECVLNCLCNSIWFKLPIKDYKKTWWLKKDKTE